MSCQLEEGGVITREAEYVDSFEIVGENQQECTECVNRHLLQLQQSATKPRRILLVISLSGIKVCLDSFAQSILMSHALKRISYATCNPQLCQFSFLARNPKAPPNIQHCHTFRTMSSAEAVELNAIVTDMFKTAYAVQCGLTRSSITTNGSLIHSGNLMKQLDVQKYQPGSVPPTECSASQRARERPFSILSASSSSSSTGEGNTANCGGIVGPGLGSISSLTESVDSWSFGLSRESEGPPSRANEQRAAPAAGSNPSPCGLTSSCSSATAMENGQPLNTTALQACNSQVPPLSDKMAFTTNTHQTMAPLGWSSVSMDISNNTTPQMVPATIRSNRHPPTSVSQSSLSQPSNGVANIRNANSTAADAPRSVRHNLRSRPLSGKFQNDELSLSADNRHGSDSSLSPSTRVRLDSLRINNERGNIVPADKDLHDASWYMPDIPRETALEILAQQDIGSFVVRNSTTNPGCFALSVKVPKYDNPTGVSHYLLTRSSQNMIRFKGLNKEWSSVTALITHHTVMRELLPCLLHLPRTGTISSMSSEAKVGDKENLQELGQQSM